MAPRPKPPRFEGDSLVVPLDRPLVTGARALLGGALLVAAIALFLLLRPVSPPSLPAPSASLAAPPLPIPPPLPGLASASPSTAAAPAASPLRAPPRAASAPLPMPSAAPVEPPPADCTGGVRIASTGSWTVSGGPQTVQSPGVYTWRCGTFALHAVSRADAAQSKQVSVTVRPGGTALVDLR